MLQSDYRLSSTTMVRRGYLSSSTMMYSNWYFSHSSYNTHTHTQRRPHMQYLGSHNSDYTMATSLHKYIQCIHHVQEKKPL